MYLEALEPTDLELLMKTVVIYLTYLIFSYLFFFSSKRGKGIVSLSPNTVSNIWLILQTVYLNMHRTHQAVQSKLCL